MERLVKTSTTDAMGIKTKTFFLGRMKKNDWKCSAFTLVFERHGTMISFPYFMGTGCKGEPDPLEALASVARDGKEAQESIWEDFADNFGYDPDSRKAKKIYEECKNLGVLVATLLTRAEMETLAKMEF